MLPRPHRLPPNDIPNVIRHGKRATAGDLEIRVIHTNTTALRFAIIVPARLDKHSTARNRIKRLVREAVRKFLPKTGGVDGVVMVRAKLSVFQQNDVDQIVKKLFQAAGIFRD